MSSRISKLLSLALRHQPEALNLEIDSEGYADVSTLLQNLKAKGIQITRFDLELLVQTNDKQRFSFNPEKNKIRANQGHSIDVELNLGAKIPPPYLYHGTVGRFMDNINKEGILRGGRQYVHLSADRETAIAVGNRRGRAVLLKINADHMHEDGYVFFISSNGVWLTDRVPVGYFEKITY